MIWSVKGHFKGGLYGCWSLSSRNTALYLKLLWSGWDHKKPEWI